MESKPPKFSLLLFPWLAHGHIFPYLELAKRILFKKNFKIYLCTTPINFASIQTFLEKNLLQNSIELVELHLQYSSLEFPPHYHTTKNLPSNLIPTLIKAFQTCKSSFSDIIRNLNPDLVIYDMFQPWAAKLCIAQGIPCVHFPLFGAAKFPVLHDEYISRDANFPFPSLRLSENEKKASDAKYEFSNAHVFDEGEKDYVFVNFNLSSDIVLMKSNRGFEGEFMDYISSVRKKEIVPVGPLVIDADKSEEKDSEILQWLNKKNPCSTVYVCFGSQYFLSKEEIKELAKGLELCGVDFIWVIRFPVGETISAQEALPLGFLESVKDRGMVVSGWAPQANILSHPSIGGFASHCGWSSITESIYFGVPIIGMPMAIITSVDGRVLEEKGACVVVPKNGAVYKGEDIACAIKKVIVEDSGEKLRIRAREMGQTMRMEEGPELEEAAEKLWQICLKNKQRGV